MHRSNELAGVIDGAGVMERLDIAARHDEVVDEAIDAVGSGIGFIPIPGLSTGVGFLVDVAISGGTEWAGTVVSDGLHQYEDVANEALAGRPDREQGIAIANVARLYSMFDLDMTPPLEGDDFDQWLDDRSAELSGATEATYNFDWYLDNYQDGDAHINIDATP